MAALTSVQVVVDESGATSGLTRLDRKSLDTFSRMTANVRRTRTELQALGDEGPKAGDKIADGMDKANSHALTSLDTVRLFRDDLGIRIPRAMEKLIASTEAFKVVAQTAFGGFAFVGVAELVGTIGSKISDWGHYLMGDTKALQDFRKALNDANDTAILSPKNADQAMKSLQLLNSEISRLEARRDEGTTNKLANQALFGGTKNLQDKDQFFSGDDEARLLKDLQMREEAIKNLGVLAKQVNDQIRKSDEETAASAVKGYGELAVQRKNAYAEIDVKVRDRELSPTDGARLKLAADRKYAADLANLNRETAKQTTEIWQQADTARLQGEDKALQESLNAQRNYEKQAKEMGVPETTIRANTAKMGDKYQAEKKLRQKQFIDETARMEEQANVDSVEGTSKYKEEELKALTDLERQRTEMGNQSLITEEMYQNRRYAIIHTTDAKIAQSTKQYLEQEQASHDAIAASSSRGYAEIAMQRQRSLDSAKKDYEKQSGGLDPNSQEKQDVDAAYSRHKVDIENETNQRIAELDRKNANDLQQLQDQALSVRANRQRDGLLGLFEAEQQQTARILAEYDKRERALKDKIDQNAITQKDAAAEQLAIEDLKNNQLAEQQREFQDRIANTLESSFRNPMAAIKSALEHEFAELLANWLLQLNLFKGAFGSTMGGLSLGAANGAGAFGGAGSTLSTILGGATSRQASTRPDGLPDFAPSGTRAIPASMHTFGASDLTGAVSSSMGLYDRVSGTTPAATPVSSASSGLPGYSVTGDGAAPSYGSFDTATSSTSGYAPTGEDGGFAGYMTGDTDDMSLAAASRDDAQYTNPVGATASQQAADDDSAGSAFGNASSTALSYLGAGFGAYTAVGTTVNAYKSGNVLQGAMGDAAAGAAIGSIVPGVGTAIGAGVGAIVGAGSALVGMIGGEGSKLAARDYYKQSLFPALEREYNDPSTDFQTAISDANKTAGEGVVYMRNKWGNDAAQWVDQNYLSKELARVTSRISNTAEGGRMYTTLSAAQFHTGTDGISDFGDLWTSPTEGFIHAELGEGIVKSMAMGAHRPYVNAMNSGASPSDIAGMYLGAASRTLRAPGEPMPSATAPTPAASTAPVSSASDSSAGDNHLHLHIHAIDTKDFSSFLRGGGAKLINKHLNDYTSRYSGDGLNV